MSIEENKDNLSALQFKALIDYRNDLIRKCIDSNLKPIEVAYVFNLSRQAINHIIKQNK